MSPNELKYKTKLDHAFFGGRHFVSKKKKI